ncbi:hypothetical protein ARMSODRAFT_162253 [Armillaria solidipes]|uniref:Uncharacterized protein n=1 Tax=Armillaria solidipes TaxID=1076256 RepID=A0A2H3BEW5_9AGAR|nr:hypothetical protein ARMSODRAFT_162253 [Armillaria solidipes]
MPRLVQRQALALTGQCETAGDFDLLLLPMFMGEIYLADLSNAPCPVLRVPKDSEVWKTRNAQSCGCEKHLTGSGYSGAKNYRPSDTSGPHKYDCYLDRNVPGTHGMRNPAGCGDHLSGCSGARNIHGLVHPDPI